jgi:pentatricopeptide repeat protein
VMTSKLKPSILREVKKIEFQQQYTKKKFKKFMKTQTIPQKLNWKLSALVKFDKLKEAEDLFLKIKQKSIPRDVNTYNILIKQYYKERHIKNFEKSEKLFQDLLNDGFTPNLETLNSLLRGYHNLGDIQSIVNTFKMFEQYKINPDILSFFVIIFQSIKYNEFDIAYGFFQNMKKFRIKPDDNIYSVLINGSLKKNDPNLTMSLVFQAIKEDISLNKSYPAIFTLYFKQEKVEYAEKLYDFLASRKYMTPIIISTMMKGYADMKLMDKAKDLFDQLLSQDVPPNPIMCVIMIYGYGKIGDTNAMKEFIKTLKHHKLMDNLNILGEFTDESLHRADLEIIEMLTPEQRVKVEEVLTKHFEDVGEK